MHVFFRYVAKLSDCTGPVVTVEIKNDALL